MRFQRTFGFYSLTPCVKFLALTNIIFWFFFILIFQQFFLKSPFIFNFLGLVPSLVSQGFIWQFFTYMFVHSHGVFHILFNLLILWMFGSELERIWGSRFFLLYYLTCGVGAGLIYCATLLGIGLFSFESIIPVFNTPVVGSSGAIFGLLAAYGVIFKDRVILFMFIFPMKALHFTYILAGVELLSLLSEGFGTPVANLAHLGGFISGYLFLIIWRNGAKISRIFSMRRNNYKLRIVKENEPKKVWH